MSLKHNGRNHYFKTKNTKFYSSQNLDKNKRTNITIETVFAVRTIPLQYSLHVVFKQGFFLLHWLMTAKQTKKRITNHFLYVT